MQRSENNVKMVAVTLYVLWSRDNYNNIVTMYKKHVQKQREITIY